MASAKKETKKDLLEKIEQLVLALKQERADAENNRRRFQVEKSQLVETAQTSIVTDLLPLLDNLERAFESAPKELQANNWVKGVLYIQQQLQSYIEALELRPIAVIGQAFNPETMEAVETVADKSKKSGVVLAEILRGYIHKNHVIRPAQVKVVKND